MAFSSESKNVDRVVPNTSYSWSWLFWLQWRDLQVRTTYYRLNLVRLFICRVLQFFLRFTGTPCCVILVLILGAPTWRPCCFVSPFKWLAINCELVNIHLNTFLYISDAQGAFRAYFNLKRQRITKLEMVLFSRCRNPRYWNLSTKLMFRKSFVL